MSIAIGKISVALLIERIICPIGAPTARPISNPSSKKRLTGLKGIDWRRAFLRAISGSVALSATVTVILFYVQCKPASALWDHRLLPPNGTAKCWNPIPVNTWDLVIASYWSLLDFLLALFPLPLILSLHLPLGRRILLSLLLSMGIFAGIAAAIKTSKVPISVKGKTDITWQTVELLLWNGIEMNIIIIAACIPTLRPIVLVLLRRGEELRDFGDDSSHRGAAGAKSGGIGHQQQQYHNGERAQSYYFGRQFGPRRRSSIPLYSNASCSSTQQATYHSAKTTSSGTSPTKQQRDDYQQQQQKSQCASLSDDSTTLEQSTPSPFHEKDLEARIHVSTHDLPSSRDSLNTAIPRPLEIYKSVQLTRTTSKADEDTATGHDNDDEECWDLTCLAHRRDPPPPLPVIRHIPITPSSPLGGNSWQQKAFEPLTIIDPDAITEAPASPLPIYRLHSTPPHPPPSSGTAGSGGGGGGGVDDDGVTQPSRKRSPSNNNNNGGLSAPLSEIGRPSPPGRSRSRSVKAVAGSSSSSNNNSNNSNSRDGDSTSGARKAG